MVPALVLIDFQVGFGDPVWGPRNNPQAETNAARLLAAWRDTGQPLAHVRHISSQPGSPLSGPGIAFLDALAPLPGEVVFEKSVNSGFIGTGLEAHLRNLGVKDVVIAGLTTPHCVSTTARMAANLGFAVTLAHDAMAAFAANADTGWLGGDAPDPEAIHQMALHHLHGEFATVRSTDVIVAMTGCA